MALPVLGLPQTREAAPNGAACCPFGAGFGLPQLSRQRSCHALHTGTWVYTFRQQTSSAPFDGTIQKNTYT